MIEINILEFIPQEIRKQMQDTLVDFVSDQAKKYANDGVAEKLKQLRSDGAFRKQFDKGLDNAIKRFSEEYYEQDEDLVDAIVNEKDILKNPDVKQALMTMLKSPGSYLANESDLVAQSFDNILPDRKNRDRVNRAVKYLLRCLVEELWHLPELQPVYSLQFQKMTADAMRQQVELQKTQLNTLTDVNDGIRQALLQLTDAISLQKLLPSGNTHSLPSNKIKHNLPQPDYEKFIGREKEFAEIINLLSPNSRHFVIGIDGVGGIGKSSLALEIATYFLHNYDSIESNEQFDAIIWVSAKKTVLTADGVISRSQAHRTLDDIYRTIGVTLENELVTKASTEQQEETVRNILSKQRTLIIIDNFETIDDAKVKSFLLELPYPTKAIVTTRTSIGFIYSVRLAGMEWEDALLLINQECMKKRVELDNEQKLRLYTRTGGVPLAMGWCIAQVGVGYPTESVLTRLGMPNNDIALFSFKGSLDIIRADIITFSLLLSLSLFASTASREALGEVAGCDTNTLDRDDGLAKLEKMSLINNYHGRFSMLPLTKNFVASEFNNFPGQNILLDNWKKWIVNYVIRYGGEGWDWRGFQKINDEIDNIVAMLDQGIEEEWSDVLIVLRYITYYMKISGRWNESNRHAEDALLLARKLNDYRAINMLATHSLGWTYAQQGDLNKAEEYALLGVEASQRANVPIQIASAKRVLGQIYRKKKNFDLSRNLYEEALELTIEHNDFGLQGNLIGELGKLEMEQGHHEKAKEQLAEALKILDGREEDRLIYGALSGHLARLNYITGNIVEAKRLGLICLNIFDEIGGVTDILLTLAKVYKLQNQKDQALNMVNRSIILFERLGMVNELNEAKELKSEL